MEYFIATALYEKVQENGALQTVKESYLVDALSFTEAEQRFTEELRPYMSGEWRVDDIKRARIAELIESKDTESNTFFKSKVAIIIIDEKSGAEKRSNQTWIVQAKDLTDAVRTIHDTMKKSMTAYTIVSVAESPILDVFHYTPTDSEDE